MKSLQFFPSQHEWPIDQGESLPGPLSPYIGNLSFLQSIEVYNNSFLGEIPAEIGQLFRLQKIDLNDNNFTGEIPANISQCSNLNYIDVGFNNLVGNLPQEVTKLSKLAILVIHYNKLTGGIPHFLGNMTSLQVISAPDNPFGGRIPDSIGQLNNLFYLALGGNNLSGTIPPSFYNLSKLVNVSLDENQLQGRLHPNIGFMIPKLQVFQVSINQLTGGLPRSFSNCSDLEVLQLSVNKFNGKIDLDFGSLKYMKDIRLDDNDFGSGEPDEMNFIDSVANCSNLEGLEISNNKLRGTLRNSVGNLSSQMHYFDLGENLLHGRLPSTIGNLVGVSAFLVDSNRFTGTIPSTIGNLGNIKRMHFERNEFLGTIPDSIGNISALLEIHMDINHIEGLIPTSLGNCQRLITLELSQNNLSGTIPKELFKLSALSISLNLSGNHLHGSLPTDVGNLKILGALDLSDNNLSGEVPRSLGSCTSLTSLFLQKNNFHGSIPTSLSSLKGVTSLDLSQNNLSGQIPMFFERFSMAHLNLSFNNFEGEVPMRGVFANESAISLVGNDKLCGGIPELHLHKCSVSKKVHRRSRLVIIVISISCTLLLVVTLMLSFLFFWRKRTRNEKSAEPLLKEPFLRVSYEMLLKATDGFSSENLVGQGSFGSVYKGVLDVDEVVVAVKVLNLQFRGASKSFTAECEALRRLRHRNLVRVTSSCSSIDFQGNDFKALVYDFMSNGSLEKWLHSSSEAQNGVDELRRLNFLQRINIAIDVACALDYLHHRCEEPIVHCDIKPSNILLDGDMVAHVGDFGLAKLLLPESASGIQSSSIGIRGTTGYVAPEYGLGSEVSTHGDVYSFGILLLEMITGKRPTDDTFVEGLNIHNFASMGLLKHVDDVVDSSILEVNVEITEALETNSLGNTRAKVTECLVSAIKIGIACSVETPQDRMSITNVLHELNSVRKITLQH